MLSTGRASTIWILKEVTESNSFFAYFLALSNIEFHKSLSSWVTWITVSLMCVSNDEDKSERDFVNPLIALRLLSDLITVLGLRSNEYKASMGWN